MLNKNWLLIPTANVSVLGWRLLRDEVLHLSMYYTYVSDKACRLPTITIIIQWLIQEPMYIAVTY
jgi:hypothetical protein